MIKYSALKIIVAVKNTILTVTKIWSAEYLIIFLHKYRDVHDKWRTKTDANLNYLRVVNGSVLRFQMLIHY